MQTSDRMIDGESFIEAVRIADAKFVATIEGVDYDVPYSRYPRLARAMPDQRERWTISREAVHWPDLDEDISIDNIIDGASAAGDPDFRPVIAPPDPEFPSLMSLEEN